MKAVDFECLDCGAIFERIMARQELGREFVICSCGGTTRQVLGLSTARNTQSWLKIRCHQDDSTRPR